MPLYKAVKTKLKLNNKQRTLMAKHAGVARWAWNWGLAICNEALESKSKLPTAIDLHKRLVAEVKLQHPWFYEVSKCAPQYALRHLQKAFRTWFEVQGRKRPRFKKKGRHDSFTLDGCVTIGGLRHKLPRLGWVRTYEPLPECKPKSITISQRAGDWYLSCKLEIDQEVTTKTRERIGVDIGINALATCSDGTVFSSVKAYRKSKRQLAHLQRSVSRKQKNSNNRQKAIRRLGKQHKRVSDIRVDALHKITTWLAKNHGIIVIENLNVSGMLKNHRLASAIADSGFYEFRRQLEYKAQRYGSQIILADQWFPSSQICSKCGHRQKMPLEERVYRCGNCGQEIDRDLNASINLEYYPEPAHSSGVVACGGSHPSTGVASGESMKQDVDSNAIPVQLCLDLYSVI